MLAHGLRACALLLAFVPLALAGPDPADAGRPAAPHRLIWSSKTGDWNRAVAVAPWGDVASAAMWRLRLHAHDTGQIYATLDLPGAAVEGGLGFAGEGQLVVVTNKGLHLLRLPSLAIEPVAPFPASRRATRAHVVGSLVAVAFRDGQVHVYRLPAADPLHTLTAPKPGSVALSADGKQLAIGCDKGLVRLHALGGAQRDLVPAGSYGDVNALAFSPAGRRLLVDRPGFGLELRDAQSGKTLAKWKKGAWVTEARFLDAARVAVTGSGGLAIYSQGAKVTPAYGGQGSTVGLAVGADGRLLAVGDRQGTVALLGFGPRWTPPKAPFARGDLKKAAPAQDPGGPPQQTEAERLDSLTTARRRRTSAPGLSSLPAEVRGFVEGTPQAERALFLRVTQATIGGEFDTAGNEEVQVNADVGRETQKLIRKVLDLPSGRLATFSFDSPWVELAPAERLAVGLRVRDEDLTEWETIANSQQDMSLQSSDFPDQAKVHEVALSTIRLTEYFFMVPKKVLLRGASLRVETIGAPRRDTPDADYRALIKTLFAALLETPLPNTTLAAHGLEERLRPAAQEAMRSAGRSTHTLARATVPALAKELNRLAHLAGDVGAQHGLTLALGSLEEQLAALPEAERKQSTVSEAQLARADAVVGRAAPTDRAGLDALHAEVLDLGARLDALDGLPPSLQRLNKALDRILTLSDRARRGLGRTAELAMGFRSLQAKVRTAAGGEGR